MEKLRDLSEMKHTLIEAVKMELAKGVDSVDTEELGEVVDMIKDLASAEKDCMEAAYYELVCEAMDDGDSEKMGYDRWRYSSGRFAPKGRGRRTYGYLPSPMMDENVDGYTINGETYGNVNGNSANRSMGRRYGYHGEPKEKLDEAMEVMGDVWAEADSDLKDRMKKSLKDLLYQMEQSA